MTELEQFIAASEYTHFFNHVKSKFVDTRIRAARAVNKNLIDFYWWLGKQIVKKQEEYGWGTAVIEQLSTDLQKDFPGKTGFSVQNLWFIRKFYIEYKELGILQQLVREIPWGHNILIFNKIKDPKAKEYYLKMTHEYSWSRDTLALQIKNQAYEHQILAVKQHNFQQTLPEEMAKRADLALKDIYTFEILNLTQPVIESEIENRMVTKIKEVMLELGYGFSFIGNQYRIRKNNKDYYIDLLFYNRKLQSLVAMEIKTGAFKPEYAGKMNFYLNLLDDYARESNENPSIGIILCSEMDHFEVEYTLRDINKPVGVSEFTLTKTLPKELQDKLPNAKELEQKIRQEMGQSVK